MPPSTIEHNLLLGVLALQLGLLSPAQLLNVLRAWVNDKARPLGSLLCEQESLSDEEHQLLVAVLNALLNRHEQDADRLLSLLLPPGAIPELATLEDPELCECLTRVGHGPAAVTLALSGIQSSWSATFNHGNPMASAPTVLADNGAADSASGPASGAARVRYRRLRSHARGGLGEVFVAHDEELQREVALKEMQAQHLSRDDCRARFLLEGEVTGRLEHPGIVPVYGLGLYPDGRPYYAMRFIRGESLLQALQRFHGGTPKDPGERALELRKLLARFVDVCNTIAYAHSKGVLHRDIKPENIMLGRFGETLVVDWGLAKPFEIADFQFSNPEKERHSSSDQQSKIENLKSTCETLMGQVSGTPQYMSPEQASGRIDLLGPASDVYSLGATLYVILAGRQPVPPDPDVRKILRMVQCGAITPPRQVNPAVPRALEAVCQKAMELAPEERYGSAHDLAADVERWLADEPVSAWREPLATRLIRWGRRHRTTVIAGAVLCVTAIAALIVSHLLLAQEQERTETALNEVTQEKQSKERALEKLGQEQRRTEKAIEDRAHTQVEALLEANPRAVPAILAGLEPFRELVRPRLRTIRTSPAPNKSSDADRARHLQHQTRASLALLAADPGEVKFLRERLLQPDLDPEECLLLREALSAEGARLSPGLWDVVDRAGAMPERSFRALVALARFDPDNPRWESSGALVVAPLLSSDPLHVGIWTRALFRVRDHLIGPLSETFSDPLLPGERHVAAVVLREYAADRPKLLARLLGLADEAQFALLIPRVVNCPDILPTLRDQLRASRPAKSEEDRDAEGRRQANLALMLLLLNEPEPAWEILRRQAYPDARTHLLHLIPATDVKPSVLIEQLKKETDNAARRALVQMLGGYDSEQLPNATREEILPLLLKWYREHPDPGLHGAVDWLLRHDHEGTRSRKLDWGQAAELEKIDRALRNEPPGKRGWYVTPQGQTMVLLGPGEFLMGSPEGEPGHESDETLHRRHIPRRFALSACEVTVKQFRQFLAAHPKIRHQNAKQYSPEEDCPEVNVTWYEAAQFCRWLSDEEQLPEKEMCFPTVEEIEECKIRKLPLKLPADYLSRTGYRLPTEAEWEYACRGGSRTSRPHGVSNELLLHYAWDVRNALARTWPVGQKKPNNFGLFDMHGNAAEWCLDLYGDYPAAKGDKAVEDVETVKEITPESRCVVRGAPFHPRPGPLRSAYRYWHKPSDSFSTDGLRVARTYRE
jgi:serine/threonine protein kinase/formylglycine-generating enzyme required for sulfatase activity